MYKFKKNFLCAGIFDHTLNVILGFIPRIHAKQNLNRHYRAYPDNLDPRVTPEDDNRMRLFFKPEYDNEVVKSVGTFENGNCIAQCGRSMIEMLGVLAIIGVLSVGGIAGYSKAMEMYKINRQRVQLSELFWHLIALKDDFLYEYKNTQHSVRIAENMEALGVIPDGMEKVYGNCIKDIFGNSLSLNLDKSIWHTPDGEKRSALEYYVEFNVFNAEKSNKMKQKYCVTFLEQAQHFSAYISSVQNRGSKENGYSEKRLNLVSVKPNEIYDFCQKCNSDTSCTLIMFFKI